MSTELMEEARLAPPTQTTPEIAPAGSWWPRAAALGGLVFFGLFLAFGTLTSNTPAAGDTRQEVFTFLGQHHDRLQLAAAVYALGMPAALLFLSGLFTALRKAEGGRPRLAVVALTGGILTAAATVTGALVLGVTATRYADLGPGGTRALWTMFLLSIGASLTGQVLLIGATAAVSLHTRLFSPWFNGASIILAVASAVGVCTIGFVAAGIQITAGAAAIADVVWILLVSLQLWRRPELGS